MFSSHTYSQPTLKTKVEEGLVKEKEIDDILDELKQFQKDSDK
jgi:hypothetical protein